MPEGQRAEIAVIREATDAVTAALTGDKPLDECLPSILAATRKLAGASYCALLLFRPEGNRIFADGMPQRAIDEIGHLPEGHGVLGFVASSGETVLLDDLTKHPAYEGFPQGHPLMRTFLGVPIKTPQKLRGIFYLAEKEGGGPFTRRDADLVESHASIFAIALENAELLERLQDHGRHMQAIYDSSPDGMHSVDRQGFFVEMNATELGWLGYTREEVIGKLHIKDVLAPEYWAIFETNYPRMKETAGRFESLDMEFLTKGGKRIPVRLNIASRTDKDGNFVSTLTTVRNATVEHELREKLLRAQRLQSLGTLAGGIAHDFNNVLTGVIGLCDLMLMDLAEGTPSREHAGSILRLTQRASGMISQLMSFSRGLRGERQSTDVKAFIAEFTTMARETLPARVTLTVKDDMEPVAVALAPSELQRVLLNLMVNAAEATGDGGEIEVSCSVERISADEPLGQANHLVEDGEYVRVRVRDNGPGIAADAEDKLFEPFFTTKKEAGSGLGLPVVYGMATSVGGFVDVASAPSGGSTFDVYLPATQHLATAPTPLEHAAIGSETVLVADDEDVVLDLAQAVLERLGYRVITAEDGEEAIARYEECGGAVDLVIADVVMPKLDGVAVAERLRQTRADLPILLITGYAPDEQALDRIAGQGPKRVLAKPFRMTELAAIVRELVTAAGEQPAEAARLADPSR